MSFHWRAVCLSVLAAGLASAAGTGPVAAHEVRQAAGRTIRLLESVGKVWKADCYSCHHQALPMMALAEARRRGMKVDEDAARSHASRTLAYLASIDTAVQGFTIIDPAVSDAYALLGADSAGVRPSLSTAIYAQRIARWQRAGGHWPTFDGRPPLGYSHFAATALAARALDLYSHPRLRRDAAGRIRKARAWLAGHQPRSVEDGAFQLLGLWWTNASREQIRSAGAALAALQRPDGSWGQTPARPGDAYSTGQALYALRKAGLLAPSAAGFQRGVRYLLETQAQDGSWHLATRLHSKAPISPPYFETGFPYGKDQVISCAASSWALMALLEALPEVPSGARPLPVSETEPRDAQPWMETALFGSAAELRRMLDRGMDPNTATSGGTTVLMMASTDPAKVKLLLERGAAVNAKSKDGFTALAVASLYPGNSRSARRLLHAGANAQGERKARFHLTPLLLASFAGDESTIDTLLRHGAGIRQKGLLLGMIEITPLMAALAMENEGAIRLLVRRGADVNIMDSLGMTPLGWAAIYQKPELVKTLLALGANPHHVDRFGMTPVQHAADIDGDDRVTVALLQDAARRLPARAVAAAGRD